MQKNDIVRIVLGVIGVTGIVIAAAACPGLIYFIPRQTRIKTGLKKKALDQTLRRLMRRGLVTREIGRYGVRLALTDKGHAEFLECGFKAQKQKIRRWDGRWRLLIFDISEKRRSVRESVRQKLQQLGFRRIQDSVWAYPYPCQDVLELLQIRYAIRHDAMIIETKHVYPESIIRSVFNLPTSLA